MIKERHTKMDKPFPYFHITTANMIFILTLFIIILQGLNLSYLNYTSQVRDQFLLANNRTVTAANKNTELVQNKIDNSTNQTTTLIKYLTDNFGAQSGYLEREEFQYQQANDTANAVKEILRSLNNTR